MTTRRKTKRSTTKLGGGKLDLLFSEKHRKFAKSFFLRYRLPFFTGLLVVLVVTAVLQGLPKGIDPNFQHAVPDSSAATVSAVQTGSVTMSSTTQTATITAVDLQRAFVMCQFRTNSSNADNPPTCQLTDPTTVTVQSGVANGSEIVHWQVVEFASGVSVKRGATSFGSGDTVINETLSPAVDTGKSFVLVTSRSASASNTIDEQRLVAAQLTSGSNLELSRSESGIAVDVEWQVVQIDDATVQSGQTTITDGNTSNTAAISSVDTTKSFLIFNTLPEDVTDGVDNQYFVRGELTNATTLTFNRRGSTNDVTLNWFLIEMGDTTSVQRGSITEGSTGALLNDTVAAVDTSRSIPIVSADVIETGNPTGTLDQDSGSWTGELTTSTNVQFQRASTQDRPSTIDWQVVEFAAAPPVIDWTACRTENGETTIPASQSQNDVTLSTPIADTSKAFLLLDMSGTSGVQGGNDHMVSGYIFDANTVRFERGFNPATEVNISYSVIECFNDEFSVQRGEITLGTGDLTQTATISTVDTANSMVLVSSRTSDTGADQDSALATGELPDATTVLVERAVTGSATTNVRYEVVEFSSASGAFVQTNEVTLGSGSQNVTDTISSVNLAESWLYCSWDATPDGLQQTTVGCDLTNATTVTFNRFASNTFNNRVRYYVVDFNSTDVIAQQGSSFFDGTVNGCADNSRCDWDVSVTPVSLVTKAYPFVTNTTGGTGNAFPRNTWISELTTTSNLQLSNWRANVSGNSSATHYWQVIEFAAAVNTPPTGTFNSATGAAGNIDLSIEIDDAEGSDVQAKIEYETDLDGACDGPWANATLVGPAVADFNDSGGAPDINNGSSYQVGSAATTRIVTSGGSNTVDFDWDSAADHTFAAGTACLRLTANDDADDQTTPDTITVAIDNTPSADFDQAAYRWFENADSTDIGSVLAAQDTFTVLDRFDKEFRLRILLEATNAIPISNENLKLQFAERGTDGICDTSFTGESYIDVTASTAIAFSDNATPADGDSVTVNGNDPVNTGTTIAQTYEELNNFSNPVAIGAGEDGMWDFSLVANDPVRGQYYCFRVVEDGGAPLPSYTVIPELRTRADVYYVCDTEQTLWTLDRSTSTKNQIGSTGAADMEAIAFWPGNDTLYATNFGDFGTLNQTTGAFSIIADLDGGACIDGTKGCLLVTNVDGLGFDGGTGILWGTGRFTGNDIIYQIDYDGTGQIVRDAFGSGVDYLEILGVGVYEEAQDIAADPTTGNLYILSTDNPAQNNSQLVQLNKSSGAIIVDTNLDQKDAEGADFFNDGTFYITVDGQSGGPFTSQNSFWEMSLGGVSSNQIDLNSQTPSCNDPEAMTVLTAPANRITGTVFEDNNPQNGTFDNPPEGGLQNVTVRLFEDSNTNGQVDGTDRFLQSTVTDVNGEYEFVLAVIGEFVLEIDTGTLPVGYALTTDNVEGAIFTDSTNFGETDENNDFGANTGSDCDGNGIPDFDEGTGDADGDGITDDCDLDNDNDGIDDAIEGTGDRDEDGIDNYFDLDSDNDGIPDAIEANGGTPPSGYSSATGRITGTDGDADGLLDSVDSLPATQYGGSTTTLPLSNFDGDTRRDYLDGDSDDDGILDIYEAGGTDADGDGFVDSFTDTNSDGYHDPLTSSPLPIPNTDGTGSFDYRDGDSDGDGIVDFREGQTDAAYSVPGIIADADGDGVIDAFDSSQGGTALSPPDKDSDGTEDYLDLNSDDDGVPDSIEGHDADFNGVADTTPSSTDVDNDGIDDAYDTNTSPSQWFDNNTGVNSPVQDFDTDGDRDWRDDNDDNDGFDTINEDFNTNLDWSDDFTQGCSPRPDYYCFTTPVDLEVVKTVDDAAPNEGDTIVYTITVTNNGPITATGIEITDNLPAGVTYVSDTPSVGSYDDGTGIWDGFSLTNGANATLDITVTVDASTAGQLITNTATRTATDQGDSTPGNDSDTADITVKDADLNIIKTVDDATPNEGDTIVYTITVTNQGPDDANNIEITDNLPAGVTYVSDTPSVGSYNDGTGIWDGFNLLNGANATLDITVTVDAGTGGTIIGNTATVTDVDEGDSDPSDNSDDEDIDVQLADLSLTKIVDDATPNEGDTVVYTITLANGGPDTATGIEVLDLLPAGVTYVSDTPSVGSYNDGTGIWDGFSLANGANATLDITATVDIGTAGTTIDNDAEVNDADTADPDSTPGNSSGSEDDEDSASITIMEADLSLTKSVDDNNPNVGDTIVFTLTVTNGGPDTATGIEITDVLPAGLTYVSDNPSAGSYNDGTGIWDGFSLTNGANATLDITATVDAGTGGSALVNNAEISDSDIGDPDSTPGNFPSGEDDEDSVTVNVQSADLSLTKVVDDATPNPGDTIVYTITVTNAGPDDADNIIVDDVLPAGVTYQSDTPSQGSYNDGTGMWTVGTVINGANATLDITVTVDAGTAGQTINNAAEVGSVDQEDPDSTPGNTSGSEDDEDDVDITVTDADLNIVKTVDDATPNEGDTIVYTITVTNQGPDDANNIEITDNLPAGVTYVSDTPSVGTYNDGTGIWDGFNLLNGANATLDITVTVDAGTGGTIIGNTATVTDVDEGDSDPSDNSDDEDIDVQLADLSLTKTVDDATPNEGDTIVFTLTVTNGGPDAATNIEVTDLLPAGVTYVSDTPSVGSYNDGTGVWDGFGLANGANATLDITVTVDGGTQGTTFDNDAEVTDVDQADPDSTPGNSSGTEDDEDSVTIDVQSSDLELTKSVDDTTPNEGDTIVYTITVQNNGPDAATNVEVTDLLPAGVTYVSDTPSAGSYNDGTGVWDGFGVGVSSFVTLQITATVDAGTGGTIIDNDAEVTDVDQADPDSTPGNSSGTEDDEDTASIDVQLADLSLTKVVDNATPTEGDTIVYTITVTNGGPDTAENIEITDLLPAGVTYVSDTPSVGSYSDGTGIWDGFSLTNGANATLDITATVDGGTAGQTIDNDAEVTDVDQADPDSTPGNSSGTEDDEDTASITVQSADLSLTKVVDDANPNEGDTIVYTITVDNGGPDTATNIEITDLLPAGVTYVSDTPSVGSYNDGTGIWDGFSLTNGANATLDITVTVDAGTGGSVINNAAEVTDVDQIDPDSTPGNSSGTEDDEDDVDVTVQSADLSLTKTVDDATPNEGDTIVFTITVANGGPDTATNVEVTDLLPAGVTYVSDTPSAGSYNDGTGIWDGFSVPNGGNQTLDITVTIDGGTQGTTFDNDAEVTDVDQADPDSTPGNSSGTEDDEDSVTIDVQSADLELTKSIDNAAPNEGDTVVYTITVQNNGPDAATNVEVTDLLPAGVTYVSDTPSAGTYNDGTGIWDGFGIGVSSFVTLQITATIDAGTVGTTIVNDAEVTDVDQADPDSTPGNSSGTEDDEDDASLTVQSADLALTKVVDNATPDEGDTITFTITVTNSGPDDAENIVVTDLLPAGLTYQSDNPSQGGYADGTGIWTVGDITNGANATLEITATVDASTAGQTIQNDAEVTSVDQADPDSTPGNAPSGEDDEDDASVTVTDADLGIVKTVDNATPDPTDTIVYTLTVTNNGPDDTTNIEVTDILPAGVTYVSDNPSAGSYNDGTGIWDGFDLTNGANATLDITVTVDNGTAGQLITNTATITDQDQSDSDPGNNSDDEDITVRGADLGIVKTVDDATPNEGDTIVYTLTITNNGPDDTTNVEVTDILPSGVTYVSDTPSAGSYNDGTGVWDGFDLTNGANATLDITVTVDAGTATQTIGNTATITDQDLQDDVPGNDTDDADITVSGSDFAVVKTVDDANPNIGDTVTYTITVTNNGPNDGTALIIDDVLPAGVTYQSDTPSQGSYNDGTGEWNVGPILNGNNATLDIEVTIDAGTAGQLITNTASLDSSTPTDPVAANNSDDADLTVQSIDLEVDKVVDDSSPNEGETVVFTITVTNNGPSTATNVEMTDILPAGVTYVSDTPSAGSYNDGTGIWDGFSLANGANATLDLTVTVDGGTQGTMITNTATATDADQDDTDNGNDSDDATITVQSADLQVTKTVDDSTPNEGDTIVYTITVQNNGPDAATNIEITDSLPAGVTYVSDTPSAGSYDDGTGVWDGFGLGVSSFATLQITATVDAGTGGTIIGNTASVTDADQSDPVPGNNSDTEDIDVQLADLSLTKTVDDSTPNEGDTITYTLTLTNNGPDSAVGVFVEDVLPAGVTYQSDTPSQGTYSDGTGTWSIGTVTNGAVLTLDIEVTVDAGTNGTTIDNDAQVDSTDTADNDSTPGNFPSGEDDEDTASITVQSADLSLAKIVDDSSPNEGETIVYTLTVTNNGPDSADNIEITDSLPAGVTYVSDTPSAGSYDDGTGIWDGFSLANGANATLDITATVDGGTQGTNITNTAEVTDVDQTDPDSTPGNFPSGEDDEDSVSIGVESADLSLTKTVDDSNPDEGDTIVFTLTVTNGGPNTATGIEVTDILPAGLTYVSDNPSSGSYDDGTGVWHGFSLANGANATLDITATVDGGTGGTAIVNNAEVTASDQADPDSTPGNTSGTEDDEDSETVNVTAADLSLTKTVDDSGPNVGDTIVYTITVTNGGPNTATNIEVTDLLPAGVTYVSDNPSSGIYDDGTGIWDGFSLTNGANATLDITATVDGGTGGTTIDNDAEVTDVDQSDPDSTPGNSSGTEDDEDSASITVEEADLELTKTVDDAAPDAGDTIVFTISVTNNGPDTATGVTISDVLPAGVAYQSDNPSQGGYDDGTGIWTTGPIGNGVTATLDITVTVDAGTGGSAIVNSAEVATSDQEDPDSTPGNTSGTEDDEDSVTVNVTSADLELAKTVDDSTPNVGDTVVFTLTLTNNGPDTATGLEVTDILPAGLTYVSDNPSSGSYDDGTGIWDGFTLTNGANATLDITATVDAGTSGTTIDNDAEVTDADQEDPDSTPGNSSGTEDDEDSASVTVEQSDLELAKTVDDATLNVGDTVVFTLTLTNNGPDTATGIEVTDLLPAGLTYVSDNPSAGSYNDGTGIWDGFTLTNGANATLDITATVDAATGGTDIVNSAEVTDVDQEDPDSTPGNTSGTEDDEDEVTVDVQAADLQVTKIVDDNGPNEGQTIQYSITVQNNGPDAATNIEITDILPAGVTYDSDSPTAGSYNDGTGIWDGFGLGVSSFAVLTITATVDGGTAGTLITNTATVTDADQEDPDTGNNTDDEDITVQATDLELTKTVDNPAPNEGDAVTFTITVNNLGPQNADNIEVEDLLPAGLTFSTDNPSQGSYDDGTGVWTVGTINSGQNATLEITATVNGGTAGSTIDNDAEVTAVDQADPDSTPGNFPSGEDDEDTASVTVQLADLSLTKVVDDASPNEGDTIVYTLTVNNDGPNPATNVQVSDLLPTGVTYQSDTPSQGTYNDGTGIWDIGTIISAGNATLDITVTVDGGTAGTTVNNAAEIVASDVIDPDSTPGNSSGTEDDEDDVDITIPIIDLELVKTVDESNPEEGDTIVFTLTLTNNGPDDATNIQVTDILPAGLTHQSNVPSLGAYNPIAGIWDGFGLANGANATLDITVTVDGGTAGTTILNNATVTAVEETDSDTLNDSDDESVDVVGVDLAVTKNVTDSSPEEGDTIFFSVNVVNNGPSEATNIDIFDELPAGVTYVSDTPSQGTYDDGTGIWDIGNLLSAAFATLDLEVTVDAGTVGSTIVNTASVQNVDETDTDPSNDDDDAEVDPEDPPSGGGGGPSCPPIGPTSVLINGNAATTEDGLVTLAFTYPANIIEMIISEDPNFIGASWQPISPTTTFQLSSGTGVKTIYALFRSNCATSVTALDTITVVEPPPPPPCVPGEPGCPIVTPPPPTGCIPGVDADCPLPPEPESPLPPIEGCPDCSRLSYDVYIVNPDGSERHMNTQWTRVDDLAPGIFLVNFEDRGLDFDYNDVFVQVDARNCDAIKFTFVGGDAAWEHEVRFKVFVDGRVRDDLLVWDNSQDARGTSVVINARTDAVCEEDPEPPFECPFCDRLSYDVYIINPDGTERHMDSEFATLETLPNGLTRINFEDRGEDFDYNDVLVDVDFRNCENVVFTFVGGDASWSHQVRFKVFVNDLERSDVLVWRDSQAARGTSRAIDARHLDGVCQETEEIPDYPIVLPGEGDVACEVECSRVGFDLYIVNPDGTERHINTPFVFETPIAPGVTKYEFEDRAVDIDYNDLGIQVNRNDCENITFETLFVNAAWSHEIRVTLLYEGVEKEDIVLWPDSQASLRKVRTINVKEFPNMCRLEGGVIEQVQRGFAVVYENVDFGGRSETFFVGDEDLDLSDNTILENTISSLRLIGGAVIRFFETLLFGGETQSFEIDIPDLSETEFGEDAASSLQVTEPSDFESSQIPADPVDEPEPIAVEGCSIDEPFTSFMEIGEVSDDVRVLQELLKCLGYFPTNIDSTAIFGPTTESAVIEFQQFNGIDPAGYVGPATREALNAYVE